MSRRPKVKSLIAKRTIVVGARKTSVSIEPAFWTDLKEIAAQEGVSVSALVTAIDEDRQHANLSSAIRLFVLEHYRRLADETAQGKGKR
jgi:predicted DNA-binding ribbon-helix-helix protein